MGRKEIGNRLWDLAGKLVCLGEGSHGSRETRRNIL